MWQNSNDVSPDIDITRDNQKIGDKYKSLSNIQTYRLVKLLWFCYSLMFNVRYSSDSPKWIHFRSGKSSIGDISLALVDQNLIIIHFSFILNTASAQRI